MSCHSGELKKDYFAMTILVYFFFFYLTTCVEKICIVRMLLAEVLKL